MKLQWKEAGSNTYALCFSAYEGEEMQMVASIGRYMGGDWHAWVHQCALANSFLASGDEPFTDALLSRMKQSVEGMVKEHLEDRAFHANFQLEAFCQAVSESRMDLREYMEKKKKAFDLSDVELSEEDFAMAKKLFDAGKSMEDSVTEVLSALEEERER